MKSNLKTSILSGLFFALSMSIFFALKFPRINVFGSFIFCFLGWSVAIFIFLAWATSRSAKILEEMGLSQALIRYQGNANHWKGNEALGGYLVLTNDRFIFWDHGVNLQKDHTEILLQDILQVKKYNSLGLVPNGLEIVQEGKRDKFVVNNRKEILQILTAQHIKCS
ncbi:MAG: hypothetical protein J6V32_02285 [Elusimicrobiaceae bacterium]|nr:hypothetical protein [Elusimicrobiaceae bacterium]